MIFFFFFSSRRRHTRSLCDWSSDVCSSDLLVAGGWVGGVARKPEGQVLAVGLGARDVAIALGSLRAIGAGYGAPGWIRAGMLADAADLAATLRARDRLPSLAAPAVALLAGGSLVLGAWLQASVD